MKISDLKVAFLDDSEDQRKAMRMVLENKLGVINPTLFSHSVDLMDTFTHSKFHVLIIDYNLLDDFDGGTILEMMYGGEIKPDTKVILRTASVDSSIIKTIQEIVPDVIYLDKVGMNHDQYLLNYLNGVAHHFTDVDDETNSEFSSAR